MYVLNPYRYVSGVDNSFKFKVTVSALETINLPFESTGSYTCTINFGDGTGDKSITAWNDADVNHEYTDADTYEISINGTCTLFEVDNDASIDTNITEVTQWGDIGLTNLNFYGCSNMTVTATDTLDTSGIIRFINLFYNCSSITTIPNINDWDVSNVIDFTNIFRGASVYNQDLDGWVINTSSPVIMTAMFQTASAFNGNVTTWTTGEVTSMGGMFDNADAFNKNLNTSGAVWNVAKVTNFSFMFRGNAVFNGTLTGWVTTAATLMNSMFKDAPAFNQPVQHFDMNGVTTVHQMFNNADSFNQNLNDWDVSTISNFQRFMSFSANFNGTLTGWITTAATDMSEMFRSTNSFNQPVEHFDMNGVTNCTRMFNSAVAFNQSLSAWNTSTITNFTFCFLGTTAWNTFTGIGSWNVGASTSFWGMFDGKTNMGSVDLSAWTPKTSGTINWKFFNRGGNLNFDMSGWTADAFIIMEDAFEGLNTTNYDLLLEQWSLDALQSTQLFGVGTTQYTETSVDSGTTDGVSANKLIQSGQDFITTVSINDIIHNTTDDTFAEVTAIDSDTQLSLDNDIMISGETYIVQSSAAAKGRYVMLNTYSWTITDGGAV